MKKGALDLCLERRERNGEKWFYTDQWGPKSWN